MSKSYSIKRIWFIKLIRRREADFIFTYNKWKNPLLLDEADKRGEQHFYSRSSSCRKSFITFSRAMKKISVNMYQFPLKSLFYGLYNNSHQKYLYYSFII